MQDLYLRIAKHNAFLNGYNPNLLTYANDNKHKLIYDGVPFGRKGYNDFITYSLKVKDKQMTQEQALDHRKRYLARATKIKGKWKDNLKSPNNLAIKILW